MHPSNARDEASRMTPTDLDPAALRIAVRVSPTTGAPCDWWLTTQGSPPADHPHAAFITIMRPAPDGLHDDPADAALAHAPNKALFVTVAVDPRNGRIRDSWLTTVPKTPPADDAGQQHHVWPLVPEATAQAWADGRAVVQHALATHPRPTTVETTRYTARVRNALR
jgi:hypothetical protein